MWTCIECHVKLETNTNLAHRTSEKGFCFKFLAHTHPLMKSQFSSHRKIAHRMHFVVDDFFPFGVLVVSSELHFFEWTKFCSTIFLFAIIIPLSISIINSSSMRRAFYEQNFPNENKTSANRMCLKQNVFVTLQTPNIPNSTYSTETGTKSADDREHVEIIEQEIQCGARRTASVREKQQRKRKKTAEASKNLMLVSHCT